MAAARHSDLGFGPRFRFRFCGASPSSSVCTPVTAGISSDLMGLLHFEADGSTLELGAPRFRFFDLRPALDWEHYSSVSMAGCAR